MAPLDVTDICTSGLLPAGAAWVIAEARAAGYRQLVCDTMPVMAEALALYERAGFARTGPYSDHPTPGAIFLRLELDS